ncbi:MAG: pyruvate kinase, partial [Candidatus Pacebacteria bacterium]|nr:pyruvate kinase [Candidatus Paceibacterota bacterium]
MIFDKKTKIVATVGPSTDTLELLRSLISAGVNVFRFNTKHNEISWHNQRIKRAQKAATELKKNIAILIDLQGPEIRIETRGKGEIKVEKGDLITIGENFDSRDISLALSNKSVFESLSKKDILLIDDGFIELVVINKKKGRIIAEVIEGGVIKDKKSLNLPSKNLNLSSLIENDLKSLDMIAKEKIDYVALSFVRNKKDIEVLRREMEKRKINAEIVSKIENKQAIDNLEEI